MPPRLLALPSRPLTRAHPHPHPHQHCHSHCQLPLLSPPGNHTRLALSTLAPRSTSSCIFSRLAPRFTPRATPRPFPRVAPQRCVASQPEIPTYAGRTTPHPDDALAWTPHDAPYFFETGYALFAKRPSRPFPPPFYSPPSGSFSDPLSTHHRSRDRRSYYRGAVLRGITNGDDAVLVEPHLIGASDGVGAWVSRPRGHAALWSRLLLHFWAVEAAQALRDSPDLEPDPISFLQRAYETTTAATREPNPWDGTATACSALLHARPSQPARPPTLFVTNLGDSQIMVIRPSSEQVIYRTQEQWHWFDCPRQLGTNSPDTPRRDAVCDAVSLEENDIVLAMTDGLSDNLWEHEIVASVLRSLHALAEEDRRRREHGDHGVLATPATTSDAGNGMMWIAEELVREARVIAQDPFAESPYMERAVEEGIGFEGGKLDDISVVVASCRRKHG